MAQENDISVIAVVVTFNRKTLLKECLSALLAQNYPNLKILVVDNNSTDGTYDDILDLISAQKILYCNPGENLGGAGGFNLGIKKAVELGCDYVWTMDDDCIVNNDSLNELINFAETTNQDFGFLSSVVKWTDGSICKMNTQKINLAKRVKNFACSQKIKLASFVSLLLRTKVIEEVGLPIKDFFIWGDDWEYTQRISQKYDCYLVANSVVTHKCKQNMGVDISQEQSDRITRYQYAYRNECYLYRKSGFGGLVYLFCKLILHTIRVIFKAKNARFKRLKIIYKNTLAGFKFNPKIEKVEMTKGEQNGER